MAASGQTDPLFINFFVVDRRDTHHTRDIPLELLRTHSFVDVDSAYISLPLPHVHSVVSFTFHQKLIVTC